MFAYGYACLLPRTITDIFLASPLSVHAPTRGEASLFINERSSFSRER